MEQNAAIIVSGGKGARMGGIDKQLALLGGTSVVLWSLRRFLEAGCFGELVLVCPREKKERYQALLEQEGLARQVTLAVGGESRQQSVFAGIRALRGKPGYLAVHDGARPLIAATTILACLEAAKQYGAAAAAVPVKDTLKEVDPQGFVKSTPDRSCLKAVQTPQVFRFDLYERAMELARQEGLDFTDDCQLAEHAGYPVYLVPGQEDNMKLTTPEDIPLAEQLLERQRMGAALTSQKEEKRGMPCFRVGHGYDVHRLVEGRRLVLGGVEIPWEKGLLGHSDADVLTHALMDSLLGAAALGDIGKLFPDNDPAYGGADSVQLLKRVAALLREQGWQIGNVDVTAVAQAPKLKPYISRMREKLAEGCGISPEQVNVKATTEEGLGFTGSGEGISAHSVAMIFR